MYPDKADLAPLHDNLSPVNSTSFWSMISFFWMSPLIWKGYNSPLSEKDLCDSVPMKINVDENVKKFESEWMNDKRRNPKQKTPVWIPLAKTLGWRFLFANILHVGARGVLVFGFVPQLIKLLLIQVKEPDYAWKGYFLSCLLLIVQTTMGCIGVNVNGLLLSVGISVSYNHI